MGVWNFICTSCVFGLVGFIVIVLAIMGLIILLYQFLMVGNLGVKEEE